MRRLYADLVTVWTNSVPWVVHRPEAVMVLEGQPNEFQQAVEAAFALDGRSVGLMFQRAWNEWRTANGMQGLFDLDSEIADG